MAGNLRSFLAEFIGTFAWVFFAAGAVCVDASMDGGMGPVGLALAQGMAVAAVFGLFGRYSLGLFNPAFTAALAVLKRIDLVKAALCLACQLLGAAVAGLFLSLLFRHAGIVSEPPFLGAPVPSGIGFQGATLLEAVLTFFLAVAAYEAGRVQAQSASSKEGATPPRDWLWGGSAAARALVVGVTASAAVFSGGSLSGAAMNPARAFGPAVATGFWSQHYIYWIGPLAGAMLGMVLSRFLFERR